MKAFFFEKKKQKTFVYWRALCRQRAPRDKVFWFFFSKKNSLPLPPPPRTLGQKC